MKRAAKVKAEPEPEPESLCDRCGKPKPVIETDSCEACGAQICDDCRPSHEGGCCG